MSYEQVFLGTVIAVLCAFGVLKGRWFLSETRKGQRFVSLFGEAKAIWVIRTLFGLGCLFGILLAADVIHPVKW